MPPTRSKFLALFAFAPLALAASACTHQVRPDGGSGLLPVGMAAPNVVGTSNGGARVDLASLRGHPAVVYFYPMDETPGCTKEACAFRDAFAKYEAHHVTIFGVSRDSEESHEKFRAAHRLPFPLVADEDGSIARAYGVSSTLGMASRVTFLVGANGRIAKIWPDVDPGVHASDVLAAVDALEKTEPPQ